VRRRAHLGPSALCVLGLLTTASGTVHGETPEYRLKAAFLFNFAQLTEWPAEVGPTLNLCVPWQDPFGRELDALQDKAVGSRRLAVVRGASTTSLTDCHLVFIPASAIADVPQILVAIGASPVLTVAESPGAARLGVTLNLRVEQNRIAFEANLAAARAARIQLSATLLRLAAEVFE
jgi:hypothetical protein